MYDTSRSCHINQNELYDLVASGHVVQVVDSRTDEDITNQTLAITLVEHDPEKLRHFPSWLLHYMIQTHEQALVQFFGRFWSQLIQAFMMAQPGTGRSPAGAGFNFPFLNVPGGGAPSGTSAVEVMNPWAWLQAFPGMAPGRPPTSSTTARTHSEEEPGASENEESSPSSRRQRRSGRKPETARDDEIAELQREVAELARRLAEINAESASTDRTVAESGDD